MHLEEGGGIQVYKLVGCLKLEEEEVQGYKLVGCLKLEKEEEVQVYKFVGYLQLENLEDSLYLELEEEEDSKEPTIHPLPFAKLLRPSHLVFSAHPH